MILNTTYLDKEKKTTINNLVGKNYSFWTALFKKPIGSHRMIIEEHSDQFNNHFKSNNNLLYGSLEIRNKGVIVRISINYETISWLIPYYKLSIYNSKHFSLHSSGLFIKFRKDSNYNMNKKFILNLISKKNEPLNPSKR